MIKNRRGMLKKYKGITSFCLKACILINTMGSGFRDAVLAGEGASFAKKIEYCVSSFKLRSSASRKP